MIIPYYVYMDISDVKVLISTYVGMIAVGGWMGGFLV